MADVEHPQAQEEPIQHENPEEHSPTEHSPPEPAPSYKDKLEKNITEKQFNESNEAENANTPVARKHRESKGTEDAPPSTDGDNVITVEQLDHYIERHPLFSMAPPELGIIVGGLVCLWTFVHLFSFSVLEVVSFALSLWIILSGAMKVAKKGYITLHVEPDESHLKNVADVFTDRIIVIVRHIAAATRWRSVDQSLAVAAASWLVYRFSFLMNLTVVCLFGIAFTLVPLLDRVLKGPKRDTVRNVLRIVDNGYSRVRRFALAAHQKVSELHDRQQAVTLGAVIAGAAFIYFTRNIVGVNPWITLASMVHLGSYMARKSGVAVVKQE